MIRPDFVLLAGGGGRRLGGRDKAALVLKQESLRTRLERRFGPYVHQVLVVRRQDQPRRPGDVVDFGAGPVAAVQRALPRVGSRWVLLGAVDHPGAGPELLAHLSHRCGPDGAMFELEGRPQPFFGLYRTAALQRLPSDDRLTRWLTRLRLRYTPLPVAMNSHFRDIDEPEDLAAWRSCDEVGPPI